MAPGTQTRPGGRGRELALARLATRQHGVVSRGQLLALGFGNKAIKIRLGAGRLHALHEEVYAVGHTRIGQRGHWWAGVLAYGENTLLSHRSAATLWGLARQRGSVVEVTAPSGRQGALRRPGLWIHRCQLHPEDREASGGVPVTSVARTLFDLAEVLDRDGLKRAWDEADRLNLLRLKALERICERGRGRHALRHIRPLIAAAQAPTTTNSPLEDRFLVFCRDQGLPQPLTNVFVEGKEVDALWPAQRLMVELDSWAYHRHRAAFERDRARDTALQAAGWRVVRLTHRRLAQDSAAVAAELRLLLGSEG